MSGRPPRIPLSTRAEIIRRWSLGESSSALGREFGVHFNYARNMALAAGVGRPKREKPVIQARMRTITLAGSFSRLEAQR